ncbi:MAG: hypothetical protein AAGC46_21125, partial [Solirubrobacteraceae bacterium]
DDHPDFTGFFRALSRSLRGDDAALMAAVADRARLDPWTARWREQLAAQGVDLFAAADAMDAVNPVYVPRNHLVEAALTAATAGDLKPFATMLEVVQDPFEERSGFEAWAAPAPDDDAPFRTFCGT